MKVSIDISMYPLSEDFEKPILEYIKALESHPELEVRRNAMSAQIFGDYDRVMNILRDENKKAMQAHPAMVIVSKMVNAYLDE